MGSCGAVGLWDLTIILLLNDWRMNGGKKREQVLKTALLGETTVGVVLRQSVWEATVQQIVH